MDQNIKEKNLNGICILIIDQDTSNLRGLKKLLVSQDASIYLAGDLTTANTIISSRLVHVILADENIEQNHGEQIFRSYKAIYPNGLFYVMSSQTVTDSLIESSTLDIDGFFSKPVDINLLTENILRNVLVDSSSVSKLDPLTELLRPYLIFRSPIMKRGLMILPKVAASNHSVLITGETGTGKEMVARAIHGLSTFANGPFVAVNCGAIPENLIEGELFGHEKGSFTGAQSLHRGKFELAKNGSLFLDEIGEMPLALQARLLRVLEEHQFYRVGGEKPIKTYLRIIAATQVNLEKSVDDGLFREDLYYRLNVLRVHLPALRERIEDIPLLSWHFLERAFNELNRNKPYPTLSTSTISTLISQPWKGNARELKNIMTRLAVLLPNHVKKIEPEYLAAYFPEKVIVNDYLKSEKVHQPIPRHQSQSEEDVIEIASFSAEEEGVFIPVGVTLRDAENMIIQATLKHTKGNRTKASKILDIGLRTIRRKVNA